MNAMTQGARAGVFQGPVRGPSFRFYSPQGGLEASGCYRAIDVAAGDHGQALEASLEAAFADARQAGLERPVAVGVIPFDKRSPSRLYVPRHVCQLAPSQPPRAAHGFPCGKARQCIECPDRSGYTRAVRDAVALLRTGRLDKAVLSRLLQLQFDEPPCVQTIFQSLRQQNPEAYHFLVDLPDGGVLVGASPELLLRKQGTRIATNPLAGSARRVTDPAGDALIGEALLHSAKDLHEHRLVIQDVERQLRPLCRELHLPTAPSLLKTAKLWHLSTLIEGELARPRSAIEMACRLHPTPALCGYPTEQARHLIAELEPFDRGVFGGIVGWCDAAGDGEWAVVIRCGLIEHTRVQLFAGAGLVSASCPEAEWQETGTKLRTMLAAFGLDEEAA